MKWYGFSTTHVLSIIVSFICLFFLFHGSSPGSEAAKGPYEFDKGGISRDVLENYLRRSVTLTDCLAVDPFGADGPYPGKDDDLRLIENIGAKFIGRALYRWGREETLNNPEFLAKAKEMAEKIHAIDPDIVLQACLFEVVTRGVEQIKIPAYAFEALGLEPEDRNFSYEKMLNPGGKFINHWGRSSVPDIGQPETQLWFLYLAGIYLDVGCEAFHLGQTALIGMGPDLKVWNEFIPKLREMAAKKARRGWIILDAHVPYHGMVYQGKSLLDFNSFPLRIKEIPDKPMEAILEKGYLDSLYGKSIGCVTPSGWKCDSLPYLVEFDNFGRSRDAGKATLNTHFIWGYDEITWLSLQDEEYRKKWLWYAYHWLRENDPNGFLQMPISRVTTTTSGRGKFRANTKSEAMPQGLNLEETIKEIWTLPGTAGVSPASRSENITISESELFGPNVYIFSPEDSRDKITSTIKKLTDEHVNGRRAQFTDKRAAVLFKPGDYSWLSFENGFYMQVSGLGKTPNETKLNRVFVQTDWLGNNNATCNFWRVIENLTLLNTDESPFYYGVSQAAPLRRMLIEGKVQFDNRAGWASGGYLADSVVTGTAGSPTQQQFILRNNKTPFTGVNWNLVALGNIGDVGDRENRSVIEETPVIYEKPFLYFENENYFVFVPGRRENSKGISWSENEIGPGKSISLNEFHVAREDRDTAESMNKALSEGKHLLLTPGIYRLSEPLEVNRADTVVLGLGLASLRPTHGNNAMNVADVPGVRLAGFFLDAGSGENPNTATGGSEVLLRVGKKGAKIDLSSNPIVLSDLFFRVGGVRTDQPCKADISLEINANSTIGDHFWIWRADHGDQVAWDKNKADYGLVVNGDDVTIYGLFVEHYQKYDTLWNGENGRMYFYQNEKAYDVPNQEDWIGPDGNGNGWASYRIADHVKKHEAWGLGMYSVFIKTKGFVLMENAIVAPETGQITIHNPVITLLSTKGGIEHIINGIGGPLTNKESNRGAQQRLPKSYNNVWKSKRP